MVKRVSSKQEAFEKVANGFAQLGVDRVIFDTRRDCILRNGRDDINFGLDLVKLAEKSVRRLEERARDNIVIGTACFFISMCTREDYTVLFSDVSASFERNNRGQLAITAPTQPLRH